MTPRELQHRREKLGFTQIELAKRLGVTQGALSKWESGQRKIPKVVKLLIGCLDRVEKGH